MTDKDCGCAPTNDCALPVPNGGTYVYTPPPVCPPPKNECVRDWVAPETPPCSEPDPNCYVIQKPSGCDWKPACNPSTPPAITCPPLRGGWGQFGSQIPVWAKAKFCSTTCEIYPDRRLSPNAVVNVLELFTNLSTSEFQSTLISVYRGNRVEKISYQEMLALTNRIMTMAATMGWMQDPAKTFTSANIGVSIVTIPVPAGEEPKYGISATLGGSPAGQVLPLKTYKDADGNITFVGIDPSLF